MSRQEERDRFIAAAAVAGLPVHVARKVLRHAATIQRCAELECSSEAADRDRVPCPGIKTEGACICDFGYSQEGRHETVTRVSRTSQQRENAIRKLLAPYGIEARFQGDPRGYCVRILRPSDRRDSCYTDGIGVPA
jgi:hypothetical protein